MPSVAKSMERTFVPGDQPYDALLRITRQECEFAAEQLTGADPEDADDAIHTARKSCKKMRALLRLFAPAIEGDGAKLLERQFRDISRRLAGARDAYVAVKTWRRIAAAAGAGDTQAIDEFLEHRYLQLRSDIAHQREKPALIAQEFSQLVEQALELPIEDCGDKHLAEGLRLQYRRARRRMSKALNKDTAENLHEWRKEGKYLWYQVVMLSPLRPKRLEPLANQLNGFCETLGDEHDLDQLWELLKSNTPAIVEKESIAPIKAVIRKEQKRLRRRARRVGSKLFKQSPQKFATRTMKLEKGD